MKRSIVLFVLAVALAQYLSVGAIAFNSPVSPPAPDMLPVEPFEAAAFPDDMDCGGECQDDDSAPTPTVGSMPTLANTPSYEYLPQPEPVEAVATPVPFVPISPIFNSPLATPIVEVALICVAPGMYGQIICYEVQ